MTFIMSIKVTDDTLNDFSSKMEKHFDLLVAKFCVLFPGFMYNMVISTQKLVGKHHN